MPYTFQNVLYQLFIQGWFAIEDFSATQPLSEVIKKILRLKLLPFDKWTKLNSYSVDFESPAGKNRTRLSFSLVGCTQTFPCKKLMEEMLLNPRPLSWYEKLLGKLRNQWRLFPRHFICRIFLNSLETYGVKWCLIWQTHCGSWAALRGTHLKIPPISFSAHPIGVS